MLQVAAYLTIVIYDPS